MIDEKILATARPCPFCGGKVHVYDIWKDGRQVFKVMCGATVDCCVILNDFDTEEEAIAAWNKRPNEQHHE